MAASAPSVAATAPVAAPFRLTVPTASSASSRAPAAAAPIAAPIAPSVPVATSAEGCASGDCLPDVVQEAEEAADAAETIAAKPALSAADRWKGAVEVIRNANPRLGKSLSYGRLVSLGAGDARLAFPTDAGFHRATVFGHARAELEAVLTQHLAEKIHLVEEKSEAAYLAANRSVAEQETHAKLTRERDIEAKVRENPAVLSVLRVLGGSLEHVQVLDANATREEAPSTPDDEL